MSTNIEERVVKMRFDNAQFEKNISQSYNSLDKFEKKLNFKGAGKGLQELQKAADTFSMDQLITQADSVGTKFDAMSVVAISAIQRMTNAAITAGTNLVKSLSIDQVTSGWQKYADKTGSVQTIMNATGKSIDEVNGYLDKLMWFSDETSYGFNDMTAAIGQLTSAGGDIDKLVPMVMGIANATAFAGKGVNEFSRSIYNLNQSYSAGHLQYMDWKSLELAGVASKQLKEVFIQTAEEMGKVNKGAVTISNFGETLKDKWADTEVMEAAFGKFGEMTEKAYEMVQSGMVDTASEAYEILSKTYSGFSIVAAKAAQEAKSFSEAIEATKDAVSSGWMKTFEIIFGNYEEAKVLWTNLANTMWDVFASGAEGRNEMLQFWKTFGGRDHMIRAVSAAFSNLYNIITAVTGAFGEVFSPGTTEEKGMRLAKLTVAVEAFFKKITLSDEAINTLRVSVKALLIPFNFLWQGFQFGVKLLAALIVKIVQFADTILAWPSKFSKVEDALRSIFGDERYERMVASLNKIFTALSNTFGKLATNAKNFVLAAKDNGLEIAVRTFQKLYDILEPIGDFLLDSIVEGLDRIANADFTWITDGLNAAREAIVNFASGIDFTDPISFFKSLVVMVNQLGLTIRDKILGIDLEAFFSKLEGPAGKFANVLLGIAKAAQELVGRLTPAKILVFSFGVSLVLVMMNLAKAIAAFKAIAEGVVGILSGMKSVLTAFAERIRGNKLLQIAVAIGALAAALVVLGMVDPERLKAASLALVSIIGSLMIFTAGMAAINKFLVNTPEMAQNLKTVSLAMAKMSASVLMLSGALAILSTVDTADIGHQLLALATVLVGMVVAAGLIGKYAENLVETSFYILSFSASVLLIVGALKMISDVDLSGAAPNLLIVGAAMGIFALVSRGMQKVKFTSMAGLMVFALDILAFMGVLKLMSLVDPANLVLGLVNMIPIFVTIRILSRIVRIAGDETLKMGASLLGISASLIVLSFALERIGNIPTDVLVKGTVVVGIMMSLFALIIAASGKYGKTLKVGASFMGMAAAILILGVAIDYIGSLSLREVVQGTLVVGALLILFGIINSVGNAANGAKSSIVAMSVALGLITASLALLTLLDFKELMSSAVALGLVMAAFGYSLRGAKDLKIGSAIASILQILAVVSILGLVFKYLDGVDPKSTLASAVGIGVVMLALSHSIDQIKIRTGSGKNLLKTMTFVLSFLAGTSLVFGLLAKFTNPQGVIQKAVALGIVMGALSLATEQIKIRTGSGKNIAKTLGFMLGFLAEATAAVVVLSKLPEGEGLIAKATALGELMLALSTAMVILGVSKPPQGVTNTLIMMAGILTFCTIVISILNAMEINEGLLEKTVALSVLLLAVSGAITVLSTVGLSLSMLGNVAGAALVGFGTAMLMVAAIGAFIIAAGAVFEHFESLEPALAKAEEIFPRLGATIGGFLGSIVGGFIGGIAGGAIEQFGTSLSNFAQNVQGFLDLDVSQETVDAIGRLAAVAAVITGVEFLESIARFGRDSSLEAFGKQLSVFGPYFADFADEIAYIPVEQLNAASGALESVAKVLAAIPLEGGLMGAIMGNKDLEGFGKGLEDIAEGLANYAAVLVNAEIDEDTVNKTNSMMESLISLNENIPRTGGLISYLVGEKNMETFGKQLVAFSDALIDFFDNIKDAGIDEDLAKTVARVGKIMANLANDIPRSGKLIDFLGSKNLGKFGEQMAEYAKGLGDFFWELSFVTIDEDLAKAAGLAGKTMAELAEVVPRSGPLIDFFGAKDIGKFGDQIGQFGAGLASFFTAIQESGVDQGLIDLSKNAGLAFTEIAEALGTNTGLSTLLENTDLGVFGDQISKLGRALSGYYIQISDTDWGIVSESIEQLKKIIEIAGLMEDIDASTAGSFNTFLMSLATAGVDNFITTFSDSEEQIQTAIFDTINNALEGARASLQENPGNYGFIVDAIVTGITSNQDQLTSKARSLVQAVKTTIEAQVITINQIGTFMINAITQSFENGSPTLQSGVKRVMEAGLAKAKEVLQVTGIYSMAFYKIGQYCMSGFVQGFSVNASQLYTKVATIGNQAVQTFANATGVNSPSKKFAEIGMYSILGFIKGIDEHTADAKKAIVKMGANVLDSIKEFFGIHSPSTVTRDEVGRYIVEGIAEGITSNMSAEEAAKKKAENIVNAFKGEFDRLASQMTTVDLEYELWQKMNPGATTGQVNAMQTEYLNSKLQNAAQRVAAAEAQYKATLQSLGESSAETESAYQTYLQEKINMADLANELSDIRNSNYDAFRQYSDLINSMYDDMSAMGFTQEEISDWAKGQSGWVDMSSIQGLQTGAVSDIMQGYMEQAQVGADGVEVVIVQSVQRAASNSVPAAKSGGVQAGNAYSQGVKEGVQNGLDDTPLWDQVSNWANSGDAKSIGIGEVEGIINGVNEKTGEFWDAISNTILGGQNAAKTADQSHSPSQVYYGIGMNEILGLTNGITDNMHLSVNAVSSLCTTLISTSQQTVPQYPSIGSQMMAGLASGIARGASGVVSAAANVAKQAIAATQAILGIHSPSREYYRIGKMIDQGLSNGILDNYELVEGSLVKITDDMKDMDYTITPIVNTSSIQAASGMIDDMNDGLSSANDQWAEAKKYRDSTVLRFDANGNVIPWEFENSSKIEGSYIKLDKESMKQIKDMIYAEGFKANNTYENQKLNDLLADLQTKAITGNARVDNREDWDSAPTYSISQNNYVSSPKALSTAELVRKTQTSLSKFANTVSGVISSGLASGSSNKTPSWKHEPKFF